MRKGVMLFENNLYRVFVYLIKEPESFEIKAIPSEGVEVLSLTIPIESFPEFDPNSAINADPNPPVQSQLDLDDNNATKKHTIKKTDLVNKKRLADIITFYVKTWSFLTFSSLLL